MPRTITETFDGPGMPAGWTAHSGLAVEPAWRHDWQAPGVAWPAGYDRGNLLVGGMAWDEINQHLYILTLAARSDGIEWVALVSRYFVDC